MVKEILEEINKQKLLKDYKKFEPFLKNFQTQEDAIKFFIESDNRGFFEDFYSCFYKDIKSNFLMNYQPKIEKGNCHSAEALFRYKIDNTSINPLFIFSLFSYKQKEEELNYLVLDKICNDLKLFQQEISTNFNVSYNVNPQLLTKDFYNNFYKKLNNNGLSASSVGIEILETSPFDLLNKQLLQNFVNNGTNLLLDDFGSGYANFNALKNFPFTHAKFSSSLVNEIQNNPENQEVISQTVSYCAEHNIKTVFEHVETKEEFDTINKLSFGTGVIQGYYYSMPLESSNLIDFVNEQNANNQISNPEN